MHDRHGLLDEIVTGHRAVADAIAALDERALDERVMGTWTRKDLIAHIGWWETHSADVVEALLGGREPYDREAPFPLDEVNERAVRESRTRTVAEIRADEAAAFERMLRVLDGASDDDLYRADRFAWTGGDPLVAIVRGDSVEHYAEHLPALMA